MAAVLPFTSVNTEPLTNGPQCSCENSDWLPRGDSAWICSACKRRRHAAHRGIIVGGPLCHCGHRDWFVGEEIVRCSYCDRSRDAVCEGYILNGPKCSCGRRDWFVDHSVYRCSHCNRATERE
ncbi:MAG TPA: hypothetical protein VM243_17475 [Phycisphaerae bacterium]|nr:hypothetical protein [Phycisphaerae bacterium]